MKIFLEMNPSNPFYMSDELIWIISMLIPIIVAILGWIHVSKLYFKNTNREKMLSARIEIFNEIQLKTTNLLEINGEFYNLIYDRIQSLDSIFGDDILKSIYTYNILNDFENNILNNMMTEVNRSFSKFTWKWEMYEILFIDLKIQRETLNQKNTEYINKHINTIYKYNQFALKLKNNDYIELEEITEFKKNMLLMFEDYFDFSKHILNVNRAFQNLVFSEVLSINLEEKMPLDKNYPTINSFISNNNKR